MRLFAVAMLTLLLSTPAIVSAAPADAPAQAAGTGTTSALFDGVAGEACDGMRVSEDSAKNPSKPVPFGVEWFRKADGSPWVYFKFPDRPPLPMPVRDTGTEVSFAGVYGQVYTMTGDAGALTGSTMADGIRYVFRLQCSKRPAQTVSAVQRYDFTSKINNQSYRLFIAVPTLPAPPGGYPVLYMLDGNWFFTPLRTAAETEIDLRRVRPFILVGIGYPTDDPAEQKRLRNFDLTAPVPMGREFGGVDPFLRVLNEEVKPYVSAHWQVDQANQALFGHSYGGAAGLRQLFRDPNAFSAYVLESPPMDGPVNMNDEANFADRVRRGDVHTRVLILSSNVDAGSSAVDQITEFAARLALLNPKQMFVSREIIMGVAHDFVPTTMVGSALEFAIPTP